MQRIHPFIVIIIFELYLSCFQYYLFIEREKNAYKREKLVNPYNRHLNKKFKPYFNHSKSIGMNKVELNEDFVFF